MRSHLGTSSRAEAQRSERKKIDRSRGKAKTGAWLTYRRAGRVALFSSTQGAILREELRGFPAKIGAIMFVNEIGRRGSFSPEDAVIPAGSCAIMALPRGRMPFSAAPVSTTNEKRGRGRHAPASKNVRPRVTETGESHMLKNRDSNDV